MQLLAPPYNQVKNSFQVHFIFENIRKTFTFYFLASFMDVQKILVLIRQCITFQNGQGHFKNLVENAARFLKYAFMRIWSYLLNKPLMENVVFCELHFAKSVKNKL